MHSATKYSEYIALLGLKGTDRVTRMEGVIDSISFDLYGCVQVTLVPPVREGKVETGRWFDLGRVEIATKGSRVMDSPEFLELKGPADKPK